MIRKFKVLAVSIVVLVTVVAVGYLIYTIEKIESESVMNLGSRGIVLFTSSGDNANEIASALFDVEKELSPNIPIKSCGTLNSYKDLEKHIQGDLKDSTNYTIIEFNRSDLIREKGVITVKIPKKDSQNYKESLERAEKIKAKLKDLKVNIIESSTGPTILNTYVCIEISSKESKESAKEILDKLILVK